jgi:hypothetical protein
MNINELHLKLKDAYSVKNLNNISLTLIDLYKNQQYSILQKIADIINDFITIEITIDGKGFSKFMMLYHPDRSDYHLNVIKKLVESNDFDRLLEYSHILKLERIEEIAKSLDSYEDIDYSPVYEWDINTDNFRIVHDKVSEKKFKTKTRRKGYTFYDAIKIRAYGNTNTEYPSYYLEDTDEIELSGSDIIDLDGAQFCIHAVTMDLSDNRITDLEPLFELFMLEELNLSDNHIGIIDGLSNLTNLKTLQLSNNFIKDISPLFELERLEYISLEGNQVSEEQINQLIGIGVTVDY